MPGPLLPGRRAGGGRPTSRTPAVGMYAFVGENSRDWTLLRAGAAITPLPLMLVFPRRQRHFVEGVAGAVR